MSYLRNNRRRGKNKIRIFLPLAVLAIAGFLFRAPLADGLSAAAQFVSKPIISAGRGFGDGVSNVGLNFSSKKRLAKENEFLRELLAENALKAAHYDLLLAENEDLKSILHRANDSESIVLSGILSKPNRSPYDTMLIDAGSRDGLAEGDLVLALGNAPVGRVAEVFNTSAKVILFSHPGLETEVVLSSGSVSMTLVGRGGGNFEMHIPRDLGLEIGEVALLPGISLYPVATMRETISDPRDSFTKALFISPVNIQQIKFVQVKIQSAFQD